MKKKRKLKQRPKIWKRPKIKKSNSLRSRSSKTKSTQNLKSNVKFILVNGLETQLFKRLPQKDKKKKNHEDWDYEE